MTAPVEGATTTAAAAADSGGLRMTLSTGLCSHKPSMRFVKRWRSRTVRRGGGGEWIGRWTVVVSNSAADLWGGLSGVRNFPVWGDCRWLEIRMLYYYC